MLFARKIYTKPLIYIYLYTNGQNYECFFPLAFFQNEHNKHILALVKQSR